MAYITLFFWSFLAATIVPIGVEPYFTYHVLETNQMLWPCVVASVGNIGGSLTILYMGILGHDFVHKKVSETSPRLAETGNKLIHRYGYPILLLSWVPFLGDLLVLIVGLSKPNILPCTIYLSIGKTARFVFLAWALLG